MGQLMQDSSFCSSSNVIRLCIMRIGIVLHEKILKYNRAILPEMSPQKVN